MQISICSAKAEHQDEMQKQHLVDKFKIGLIPNDEHQQIKQVEAVIA